MVIRILLQFWRVHFVVLWIYVLRSMDKRPTFITLLL